MNATYRFLFFCFISGMFFSCDTDDSDSSETGEVLSIEGKWQLEQYFTNDGAEDLLVAEASLSDCEKLSIIEVFETGVFMDTGYFTSSADSQCVIESSREGTWEFIISGVYGFSYRPEDVISEDATEGIVQLLENRKLSLSFSYGSDPTIDRLIYRKVD